MIIGSSAAKYHRMNRKVPKDMDLFIREGKSQPKFKCDYSVIPIEIYNQIPQENGYITKNGLYSY